MHDSPVKTYTHVLPEMDMDAAINLDNIYNLCTKIEKM